MPTSTHVDDGLPGMSMRETIIQPDLSNEKRLFPIPLDVFCAHHHFPDTSAFHHFSFSNLALLRTILNRQSPVGSYHCINCVILTVGTVSLAWKILWGVIEICVLWVIWHIYAFPSEVSVLLKLEFFGSFPFISKTELDLPDLVTIRPHEHMSRHETRRTNTLRD